MKKITSLLLTLVMLATAFTAFPVSAASVDSFAGGTGTKDDPYQISNKAELQLLNELVNSGATYTDADEVTQYYYKAAYKLTADIDFENGEWTPLGQALGTAYDPTISDYDSKTSRKNGFEGTFDGNNHVIRNVKLTHTEEDGDTIPQSAYLGFFGSCISAEIKNLGLDNIDIQWYNYDYAFCETKTECATYIGALAGRLKTTKVTNCYVVNSTVKNTNTGTTSNETALGGFIGTLNSTNTITNCYVYNMKICSGMKTVQSGFVGEISSGSNTITNCYAAKIACDATTTYPTTYGFVKNRDDKPTSNTVTNCYSTLGDAQGNHVCKWCCAKQYDSELSLGETSATAQAISNAMVATGAYEQNAATNGGYPYLKVGFDGTAATSFAGGSGTSDDPYQIATAAQLLYASRKVSSGHGLLYHFVLANDIDYNYQEWEPFGTARLGESSWSFQGSFDGRNHVVRNLVVSSTSSEIPYKNVGFFGRTNGAVIKNLGIENIQISVNNSRHTDVDKADMEYIGGFAGYLENTAVENCFVKNSSVWQTNYSNNQSGEIGGFTGMARGSGTSIKNCYAYNLTFKNGWQKRSAGFVGSLYEANGASFENCFVAVADVYSKTGNYETTYGFGFIGTTTTNSPTSVVNCYSTLQGSTGVCSWTGATVRDYNTAYAFGEEGATQATIVSQFEDVAAFGTTDASINGGYPYLAFETPAATPDYTIKSVAKEVAVQKREGGSGSYTATYTNDHKITVGIERKAGVSGTAKVYVAGYDADDRLTGAQSATINLDDFSFPADVDAENAKTIKVFLWDDDQAPIVDAYEAKAADGEQLAEVWTFTGSAAGGSGGNTSQEPLPATKTRLVMMGDSLMDSHSTTTCGWEGCIGDYLNDDMTIIKHGHSGSTVQMLINGRETYHVCNWESITSEFGKGDYLILGLGTNDNGRLNGDYAGTDQDYSVDQFKAWYKQIIADVKAKDATIILLTPPPNNNAVKNGEFYAPETLARTAIKDVAAETGVPVLDVTQLFADALNAYAEENGYTATDLRAELENDGTVIAQGIIFGDYVHFTKAGADLLAKTVATELAEITGIKDFIVLP